MQEPHTDLPVALKQGVTNPRLILLGSPGCGKGTQAQLLGERLGACHLSTGELFRNAASRPDAQQTPAMKAAYQFMQRGELVPDATVWEMVRERSECLHCPQGFLLDGFPRTLTQAETLKKYLRDEKLPLNATIDYVLPLPETIARLSGRRVCKDCRSSFHVTQRPPKIEGICDDCGGPLYQREDDRPESIAVRLEVYQRSTEPLIHFYRNLGLLLPIDATGCPEEIFARTMSFLNQRSRPR
jgi:adenylate kinase